MAVYEEPSTIVGTLLLSVVVVLLCDVREFAATTPVMSMC